MSVTSPLIAVSLVRELEVIRLQLVLPSGLRLPGWCLEEVRADPWGISPSGDHQETRNATPSLMTLPMVFCHARLLVLASMSSSGSHVRGCPPGSSASSSAASLLLCSLCFFPTCLNSGNFRALQGTPERQMILPEHSCPGPWKTHSI